MSDAKKRLRKILYASNKNDSENLLNCLGHCSGKYPKDDLVSCQGGHKFCLNDARAYAQSQLGKGILVLKCIKEDCDKIFPGIEVLRFIDLAVFKGLPRERLEKTIKAVGVTDLVELCPKCDTVVVCGPEEQTQLIQCPNETCNAISCRKCKSIEDHLVSCQDGHKFCLNDARAYAQSQLGKGILVLKCIKEDCDKIFPGIEVLRFIDLAVFKGLPRERLEKMIKAVGVTDLVELCPKCDTVVVCGPEEQTKLIQCPNETCNAISCRKCKSIEDHLVSCQDGHKFCLNDARAYAQSQLGKGILVLKCIKEDCDKIFPGIEVLHFIDLAVFKGLPRERLEKMIKAVGVTDLVELCPKCDTVVVCGPEEQTKLIQCPNETCNAVSCRKCKYDHSNRTCEEAAHDIQCHHCSRLYPSNEIVYCEAGHAFCMDSVKQYPDDKLWNGAAILKCRSPLGCNKKFPRHEVLRFIDLNIFSHLSKKEAEMRIDELGLRELIEVCSNCDTVMICGPVEEITIFRCTNSECNNEFCRKCKEKPHGYLPCAINNAPQKSIVSGERINFEYLIAEAIATEALKVRIEAWITNEVKKLESSLN